MITVKFTFIRVFIFMNFFGKIKNPKVIFEFGSFDGRDALKYHQMFPNAIIYCFEADESNIERMKNKIGNNNKIKINHYAISDIDGEVDFYPSKMIGKNEQIFGKGGGFAGSIKKQTEDHINGQKIFNLQDFSEEVIKVPSITIKIL